MSDIESDEEAMECGQQAPGSLGNRSNFANGQEDDRRAHHNALERKRRDHIKDSFTSLREVVPTLKGEKASRALILKKAADYIHILKDDIDHQRNDIAQIRKQNEDLAAQLKYLPSKPQPRPSPVPIAPRPVPNPPKIVDTTPTPIFNPLPPLPAPCSGAGSRDFVFERQVAPAVAGHDYFSGCSLVRPTTIAGDSGTTKTTTPPAPIVTRVPGLMVRPNVNASQTPAHQNYILLTGKGTTPGGGAGKSGDTKAGGTSREVIVTLNDT